MRLAPSLASLACISLLAGCTVAGSLFGGDSSDYKTTATKTQPLEVPPDLTQLARESRYQPQGGVISAAAATNIGAGSGVVPAAGAVAGAAGAAGSVAPNKLGDLRLEKDGQQRWLVSPQTPEQLWPQLRAFWEANGFTLAVDNPQTGLMETNWVANKGKSPRGGPSLSASLGGIFSNLFDSGERDLYRTRVERSSTGGGSEIYITHRGAEEVAVGERRDADTTWRGRGSDPQLEADILVRLMVALGAKEEAARSSVAAAPKAVAPTTVAAATAPRTPVPAVPATAPAALPQATSMMIDETFDRAWRRVGLALDRGGFTVEDRDRAAGLYYVRYIDPKSVGKEEPGWWTKLWGGTANPQAALRYRILLKTDEGKTRLSVLTATGAPDEGENARRIVALLSGELR